MTIDITDEAPVPVNCHTSSQLLLLGNYVFVNTHTHKHTHSIHSLQTETCQPILIVVRHLNGGFIV